MRTFTVCVALGLILISSMYAYLLYFADSVAQCVGGYGFSMFALPLIVGAVLGRIAAGLLGTRTEKGWRTYGWVVLLGACLACIPTLYYLIVMMFFMEGS